MIENFAPMSSFWPFLDSWWRTSVYCTWQFERLHWPHRPLDKQLCWYIENGKFLAMLIGRWDMTPIVVINAKSLVHYVYGTTTRIRIKTDWRKRKSGQLWKCRKIDTKIIEHTIDRIYIRMNIKSYTGRTRMNRSRCLHIFYEINLEGE